MKAYQELSREELLSLKTQLEKDYEAAKGKGLKLDMSRGKPAVSQLEMAKDFADALTSESSMKTEDGVDVRNYGLLDGIPEAKKLMADIMGVSVDNVIVCGNGSLSIMYDTVSRSVTHGVCGSTPWCKLEKVKFLCPAPGYDRHFAITQHFGIEMITVPMTPQGPDMDIVEKLVAEDESIKGIWCVPKYSNPQGYTYSDETVKRFAALKPAAEDFRIYWDNAYAIHDLYEDRRDSLMEILSACEQAGNPDMVYEFSSTSKISYAGAGIAAIAASRKNLDDIRKSLTIQTIGFDKVNQLRHVRYFKDINGIKAHMAKHAAQMRPKFEAVLAVLDRELSGLRIGEWTKPNGGYFISFDAMEGCAKEIVARCKEAGVVLTGAGATFPYGKDSKDSNIRIAPSFPTPEEMAQATDLFVLCVKLVSVKKLLERMEQYKRLKRELVAKGAIIDYYRDTMLIPNGNTAQWDLIDHKGAAAVVAVREDGKLLMVRQYRNALERETLELPAGGLNGREEPTDVAAARELEEETGYTCGKMELLNSIYTTVAFCNEKIDIYLATELGRGKQHLDEDEYLNVEAYELEELKQMIYDCRIQDSKTICGIMTYASKVSEQRRA